MSINFTINISNPEAITYSTEEISYTILGGIRLEGLDRLWVTIKIEVINRKFQHYLNNPDIAALAIRQNLDLYSITQVERDNWFEATHPLSVYTSAARRLQIITTNADELEAQGSFFFLQDNCP